MVFGRSIVAVMPLLCVKGLGDFARGGAGIQVRLLMVDVEQSQNYFGSRRVVPSEVGV